jgi:protein-tyrosine kinase
MAKIETPDYYLEDVEKPIDFKHYLYLFKKNFTHIFTFFVIAVTCAVVYANRIPDIYRASAQIILERPRSPIRFQANNPGAMAGMENQALQSFDEDYYNTEAEIMRSNAVMMQVVENLKLIDYFGVELEEDAAARVRGMILAKRSGTSRIFNLTVTASDPQLAANIANAVARAYIRKNFENVLYYSREVLNWLPEEGGKPTDTITITDPDGRMREVRRADLMETLPALQTDPTLRQLREKKASSEAEIQLMTRQFREKHPLMVKARANHQFITESIDEEKKRIIEELKSQAAGEHRFGTARLIEEAKVPKGPIQQARYRIVLIIGAAELILSLIVVILIDYFDHTIRNVEDLERKGIAMPFLGHIPMVKRKKWEQHDKSVISAHQEIPELGEAFRYIRVAINFSGSPESIKLLAFSSCLPHEGKSFVSHNIAISLALDGNRTLLVDADLRRPVVHRRFAADNSVGLSNYLTSNLEFDSILKESHVENLTLVCSGPVSPNPTEILGSARMRQFMDEAKKKYDRVIIDCPPLTGIGDSYVVGAQIGQIIMILGAGQTPADLIKQNQKQLDKAQVKVMGMILNMVDTEKERYGGYYQHYHHTYSRYYRADPK